jgi:hypothetical protein
VSKLAKLVGVQTGGETGGCPNWKLEPSKLVIQACREAWQLLKTVRVVELGFGDEKISRSVTQGSGRAAKILKILAVKNLDPDTRRSRERAA